MIDRVSIPELPQTVRPMPATLARHPFAPFLGLYDNERGLVRVGQVAQGFTSTATKMVGGLVHAMEAEDCPFDAAPRVQRLMYWCRPELVCRVEYGEFTEAGILWYPLRHAWR